MKREAAGHYAAFAACTTIWGSTFLAIRIGNESVPPVWGACLRLILAAAILSAVVRATGQRLPRGAAFRAAFWYGFLVFGVNFPLLYWGERTVPSGITAVLYATIPLSTALFARALGQERLTPLKLGGALIALAGTGAIFSGELRSPIHAAPLLGIVLGTLSASLGGVLLKRGPAQSSLVGNALGAGVGAIACLLVSTLIGEPHSIPRTTAEWFPLLYLTLAGSVVAFVLYAWLLKHWSATRASYISVMVPVVALALGALVRDERLSGASLAGTSLIMAGVICAFQSHK